LNIEPASTHGAVTPQNVAEGPATHGVRAMGSLIPLRTRRNGLAKHMLGSAVSIAVSLILVSVLVSIVTLVIFKVDKGR
jgi:hypothetical protein